MIVYDQLYQFDYTTLPSINDECPPGIVINLEVACPHCQSFDTQYEIDLYDEDFFYVSLKCHNCKAEGNFGYPYTDDKPDLKVRYKAVINGKSCYSPYAEHLIYLNRLAWEKMRARKQKRKANKNLENTKHQD